MNYVEEESSDQALFGGKKKKVIFKKQKTNKLNFGIIVENRDTLVGVVKSWLSLYSKEMLWKWRVKLKIVMLLFDNNNVVDYGIVRDNTNNYLFWVA